MSSTQTTANGKRSAAMKKKWQDPEYRSRVTAAREAANRNPEVQERQKAGIRDWYADPVNRENKRRIMVVANAENTERNAAIGAATHERWQDPEYRARHSAALKEKWTDEQRELRSVYSTELWKDPKHREKMSKARKQLWLQPEYRSLVLAARQETYDTPEWKERQSESLRRAYAEGRKHPVSTYPLCTSGELNTLKAGIVHYRSGWEKALYEILDSSPLVKMFAVEPFGIKYKYKGKIRTYFPDCFVELFDGRRFLLEVKGVDIDPKKTKAKLKAGVAFCKANGIEFKVLTDKVKSISALLQ